MKSVLRLKWRWAAAPVLMGLLAACLAWAAPAEKATEGAPTGGTKVLARVEGQDITEEAVMQLLQSMGPQGMMMYGTEQGRQMILEELISVRLFALDAVKAKLDETPEFKKTVEDIRTHVLAQMAMREAVKDITVSDEEARRFYDEHTDQFKQPERIHARHILLNDDAESADKMAKVQADLKAGVSFDEVAKAVSVCPSASQGGDLGEFQKGQMVPEFEAAAFALKDPGDISEPVKTQFGWHIIKLEGRVPESVSPFDDVKAQITQELQNTKASDRIRARIDELKKTYKVEILDTGKEPEKKD